MHDVLSGIGWLIGVGYLAVSAVVAWALGQVLGLRNRRDPRPPLRLVTDRPECGEVQAGRGYTCTLRDGHPADHLARGEDGRLLATWPRAPRVVDVPGGGRLVVGGEGLTDAHRDELVRAFRARLGLDDGGGGGAA